MGEALDQSAGDSESREARQSLHGLPGVRAGAAAARAAHDVSPDRRAAAPDDLVHRSCCYSQCRSGCGQAELADEIHQYYLVHPLKKGEQHYRLLPKERDHDSYLALVSGQSEPTGRMADALAYFEERLSALAAEDPQRFRSVFDTVCQRFEFMCATLEAENAYNIFKSLNSTGVPLGPSDLIRNFVFMHVAPDEQDEFDRTLWGPARRVLHASGWDARRGRLLTVLSRFPDVRRTLRGTEGHLPQFRSTLRGHGLFSESTGPGTDRQAFATTR